MNSIANDINYLLSLDPISGIYIIQEWNHCWATIYVNYVHILQVVHFFCATLYYYYYYLFLLFSFVCLLFTFVFVFHSP